MKKASLPTLSFIGAGAVGTALAVALSRIGYFVTAVASRSVTSAQRLARLVDGCHPCASLQEAAEAASLTFITTGDEAIARVAGSVSWRPGQWVVHCSGAYSLDVLEPAQRRGAVVGSIHPLQSFASYADALELLQGITFALEGEGKLLTCLQDMSSALGGRWIVLDPGEKALYHTAAVMTSNYSVALIAQALKLWRVLGVQEDAALEALLPLLRGTVDNLGRSGIPAALTGPIARGDVSVVAKHLEALAARAPRVIDTYRVLGLEALAIARAKGGLAQEAEEQIRRLLTGERRGSGDYEQAIQPALMEA